MCWRSCDIFMCSSPDTATTSTTRWLINGCGNEKWVWHVDMGGQCGCGLLVTSLIGGYDTEVGVACDSSVAQNLWWEWLTMMLVSSGGCGLSVTSELGLFLVVGVAVNLG